MISNRGQAGEVPRPNFRQEAIQLAKDRKDGLEREAKENANIIRMAMCEAYR